MSPIPNRLATLRARIRHENLTHLLIPSSDEHLNEYVPPRCERRRWASGFTGSAGELLVGAEPEETWLFTDSRYHLQAQRELEGTGIGLHKVGLPDAKTLGKVLTELAGRHGARCRVGIDPMTVSATTANAHARSLESGGASLVPVAPNPVDLLWIDRPDPAFAPLDPCPAEWSSRSPTEKVAQTRHKLTEANATALVTARLDPIAWITGLRGADVPFNPVFEAYLVLDTEAVHLFVRDPARRLPNGAPEGFTVHPYEEFQMFLRQRLAGSTVLLDRDTTPWGVATALEAEPAVRVIEGQLPLDALKARKDERELACMARASLEASTAKARSLLWLDERVRAGEAVTEKGFADHLEALDGELEGFAGLSFPTIAATGDHGAIVHYGAADDTPLAHGDLFLVDSGIHLAGGTTDDTRTVSIGIPSTEHRRMFTAVLKGHIAGASLVFPEGTAGAAVDAACRKPLWEAGLDYGHGTGHGVGAFLNVHEGPFTLAPASRRPPSSTPLASGMVTSIEPGCYLEGFGGVRLENLYRIVETGETIGGRKALGFEPLTWIPFDRNLIDVPALTGSERDWLDSYHARCREFLEPRLPSPEAEMLAHGCRPV